ncbi:cytochrome P450 2K6-like isoform X2 [Hyperolius riggenbachi]
MYFTDPVTTVLSIVTCVFLAIGLYGRKRKVHPNYPPGPPRLPFIGNMHMIHVSRPHLTFHKLAEKYGPIYSVQIGAQEMVVLCGHETIKEALVNHAEEFSGRPVVPALFDLSNGHVSVLLSDSNNWKTMRRFTLSTLRQLTMGNKSLEDNFVEEGRHLVKAFKAYKGKPFDDLVPLTAAAVNNMMFILTGNRLDYDDPKLHKLATLPSESVRIVGTLMALLYNAFPTLMRWMPGSHKDMSAYASGIYDFARETLMEQKKHLDVSDQRSLIDIFLVRQKEEKPDSELYIPDDSILTIIVELFVAGFEASSVTVQWGLLLMMKYPEIQKNVQNEIDKVIGSGEPCLAHRKQMPYTNAVVHEIQRFVNVTPTGVPRRTTVDVTLKGFFLPKGTYILPLLHSVLRDKEYFEKPDEFYPQHFLDSDGNFVKNEAFLPFSSGKRSCVGENLAKMKLFLLFTTLVQNFTFHPPPGAKLDLTSTVGFTACPQQHEICAVSRS